MNISDSSEQAACSPMHFGLAGGRSFAGRHYVRAWRRCRKFWLLAALIPAITSSGCGQLFFTDAVEFSASDRAAADMNECLSDATQHQLQFADNRSTKELAPLIVATCDPKRTRYESLIKGERNQNLAVYTEGVIATQLQIGRAVREGMETVINRGSLYTWKEVPTEGLDSRLRSWDRCVDSAVPFFARGNPYDDPQELAQQAAWASYYCEKFSVYAMRTSPDSKGFSAVFELVRKHELERRPIVAKSIAAMQTEFKSQ